MYPEDSEDSSRENFRGRTDPLSRCFSRESRFAEGPARTSLSFPRIQPWKLPASIRDFLTRGSWRKANSRFRACLSRVSRVYFQIPSKIIARASAVPVITAATVCLT